MTTTKLTKTGQLIIDTLAKGGTLEETFNIKPATKRSTSQGTNTFWLGTGVKTEVEKKVPATEVQKLREAGLIRFISQDHTKRVFGLTNARTIPVSEPTPATGIEALLEELKAATDSKVKKAIRVKLSEKGGK